MGFVQADLLAPGWVSWALSSITSQISRVRPCHLHPGTAWTQLCSLPRANWTGSEPLPYQPTFYDGWQLPELTYQVRGAKHRGLFKALVSG